MPADKLVLGMSAYGRGWVLESSEPNQPLGSPAKGPAPKLTYTGEDGVASYYEILEILSQGGVKGFDETTKSPYVQKGDLWYSYEDPDSVMYKLNLITELNLKGGMVWAVDLDDFNNGCPMLTTMGNYLGRRAVKKNSSFFSGFFEECFDEFCSNSVQWKNISVYVLSGVAMALLAVVIVIIVQSQNKRKTPAIEKVEDKSRRI